jgi:nitrate/nitrite-specific signal transduction histidine kinase
MGDDSDLLSKKAEFIDSFFRKGAEFTRDMLEENEHLRRRVIVLEAQVSSAHHAPPSSTTIEELVEKIHSLEEERRAQLERFKGLESIENRLSERYAEIERENSDLASLYVAQSQLFSSLRLTEVVQVLIEIMLNFVGADCFAILLGDASGGLQVLAAEGCDAKSMPIVPVDQGSIGTTLSTLRSHVEESIGERREPGSPNPYICIPLVYDGHAIGVISVWGFLQQKESLVEVDRRIFEMLADSGGRALEASRLAAMAHDVEPGPGRGSYEEYAALLH